MRRPTLRHVLIPLTAAGLLLSSCASTTANRRTTTITSVVTGGEVSAPASSSGAPTSGSGITVVAPSGSASGSTGSPSPSASPSPTASPSPKPTPTPTSTAESSKPVNNKINPLDADCGAVLNAGDIKKVLGVEVPTAMNRIRDVANPDRGITGKIRCLFGVKGDDSAVAVGLTKYKDAASAKKQVGVTREFEQDKGAVAIPATVNGYPADVLLRDGGLILVQYGSWTMGLAVKKGLLKGTEEEQAAMLEKAAELVMNRLTK